MQNRIIDGNDMKAVKTIYSLKQKDGSKWGKLMLLLLLLLMR